MIFGVMVIAWVMAGIAWASARRMGASRSRIDGMLVPYFALVAVVLTLFAIGFTWRAFS